MNKTNHKPKKEYKPTSPPEIKNRRKGELPIVNGIISQGKKLEAKKRHLISLARKCAKLLKEKYKVKRVFLIGSLVYGIFHEKSDIDLVVEGLAPELYISALVDLSDILQWKVEVNLIPFEDAFESLREKTLRKGLLIYG